MALFAMLSVLSSPALAFACCCSQGITPSPALQTVQTPVAPSPAPVSHPGCHGHAQADSAQAQGASASETSVFAPPSASFSEVVAPYSGPEIRSLCGCEHAGEITLAFVEAQNSSSFSPLVMGAAVRPVSFVLSLPSSVRFAFASGAARPRGPDLSSRSGRAPPVFSL